MGQGWVKRGLLLAAPTGQAWARSHAALPTPGAEEANGGLAVYYSPRDERGRAHVARAHVAVESDGGLALEDVEEDPVLAPGALGAFDDAGVTVSCLVDDGEGSSFLYYTGWALGVSVPFYLAAGLAVRRPGEPGFTRVSQAPLLERCAADPFLTASPWVLREDGLWRMWYVSCVGWELSDGAPRHRYHIRYAESADGMEWRRDGRVAIDFADDREYAHGRPCVVRDGDRYRMWFSARGDSYRLAYAESPDGLTWTRDDAAVGLEPAAEGWDANMVTYPAVIERGGRRWLLYNGDDYGRTGIGYAVA